jgi:hypothetical protein
VILLCAVAFGQAVPAAEGPKRSVDFFGGYSFGHGDFGLSGLFAGWDASVGVRLSSWFAVEGIVNDISATSADAHKYPMSMLSGAAGPKVMYTIHHRYVPWVHTLFGANRLKVNGGNWFFDQVTRAEDIGFGMDLDMTKHISIRPGEVDFLPTGTGPHGATNIYYAGGIVFHLLM